MKKLMLSVVFVFVFVLGAAAQGRIDLASYFNDTKAGVGDLREKVGAKETSNAIGSPYLLKTFSLATISGVNENILVKYNAYADEMELDNGDNKVFILPKDTEFHTITLRIGTIYRLFNYKDDGKDVKGYLVEKVNNNGVSLLMKEKIVLLPEKQPVNGYGSYVPAKFDKISNTYFLELKDKNIVEFPKSKKKLTELFKGKESEIDAFLKANKVSFKEEQDMMKIVNFIATL